MVKVIWQTATWPHMDGSIVFVRWRQCAPNLTLAFLDQPESTYRTASRSVQSFAQLMAGSPYTLQRAAALPLKTAPLHGVSGPHLNYASLSIWHYSKTGCDGMGTCYEKKTMTGWRSVWNMRWRAPDQEVDQRGCGERLCTKKLPCT